MLSRFTSDFGSSSYPTPEQHLHNELKNLNLQIRNIKAAKNNFLKKMMAIDNHIESTMQNIVYHAREREKSLKNRLEEIGKAKNLEWTRQLKLCEDAEKCLASISKSSLDTFCRYFAKNIGFIDAGEIKFEASDFLFREEIEKFGKVSISKRTFSTKVQPKFIIGKRLKGFNRPWGVCFDAKGRILVTDRDNDRVHIFNDCGKSLFSFGKSGTDFGKFNSPTGITSDKEFRIIVSDSKNHRVQVFTSTGKFVNSFGERGTKAGQFQHPWDVSVNENDDIAVSDSRNQRVQLFSNRGDFIAQFNFFKSDFNLKVKIRPRGIAFRPDGSLLITDVRNSCILLIDKFFSNAIKIEGNVQFVKPQGVSCNRNGTFAVSDSETKKIQMFDKSGYLFKSLNVRKLGCLLDICLLPNEGIIAADIERNRVLIFE